LFNLELQEKKQLEIAVNSSPVNGNTI